MPVGGELVEHPQVGRVRDGQSYVGGRVGRVCDRAQVVVLQVRVVDADEGQVEPADLQSAAGVGQVEPAVLGEGRAQVAPRQLRHVGVAGAVVGQHVAERVAQPRLEVVVGAVHEHAGHVEQRPERVGDEGDRALVGEVVAGVDHQVGAQRGEARQPLLLAALARGHVHVAEVQHPQRVGAGRQQRHLDAPQHELPGLAHGVRRHGCAAERRGPEEGGAATGQKRGEAHQHRLSQCRS